MNAIHFVLQGKGGVGKSHVASMLSQYLLARGDSMYFADTDPVNDTFAGYKAFSADRIELLNDAQKIDERAFDAMIEKLVEHDGSAVIDNGASTFLPLSAYLYENHVVDMLQEAGKKVFLHTVVTGGQAMGDTIVGLATLIEHQEAPIVVWANEFFGDLSKNGVNFVDSQIINNNADRIVGTVTLAKRNPDTFGKDIELMVKSKMTFDEAMSSDLFTLMPRQRLKSVRKDIFDQLDALEI